MYITPEMLKDLAELVWARNKMGLDIQGINFGYVPSCETMRATLNYYDHGEFYKTTNYMFIDGRWTRKNPA